MTLVSRYDKKPTNPERTNPIDQERETEKSRSLGWYYMGHLNNQAVCGCIVVRSHRLFVMCVNVGLDR